MPIAEIRKIAVLVCEAAYLVLGEGWSSRLRIRTLWRRWIPDVPTKGRRDLHSHLSSAIYAIVMVWLVPLVIGLLRADQVIYEMGMGMIAPSIAETLSMPACAGTQGIRTKIRWIHPANQLSALAMLGGTLVVGR